VNCSSIALATGIFNESVCNCPFGFVWNATTSSCINISNLTRDCSQIANTNGTISSAAELICQCIEYYFWNGSNCQISCSIIPFASGTVNDSTCSCQDSYTWWKGFCVPSAMVIDCSTVANSYPVTSANSSCTCFVGFYWNGEACQINCSALSNAVSIINTTTCECIAGSTWNIQSFACLNINENASNCSAIFNSSLAQNESTCACFSLYYWNGVGCQINCTKLPFTSGIVNLSACSCFEGFTWLRGFCTPNNISMNCSLIIDSVLTIPDGIICECFNGTVWDSSAKDCVDPNTTNNCSGVRDVSQVQNAEQCACFPLYSWTADGCQINCQAIPFTSGNANLSTCNCI
jgi:hypothetical protein